MFITLEDESADANLIVWPRTSSRKPPRDPRRLDARLPRPGTACERRHPHLIVEQVSDLSAELRRVSGIDTAFPAAAGRGDDAKRRGSVEDSRDPKPIVARATCTARTCTSGRGEEFSVGPRGQAIRRRRVLLSLLVQRVFVAG